MFCSVFFIHLVATTNDRKHAVSPPNHIKLRPHFIYMSCLWWFNLNSIYWLILFLMSPIKTCETSMPILSNMGWMSHMFPWLPWTLTCCHEFEATSSNMLLVVIQIISRRQTVIVMMNLWYCNCESNCKKYKYDDEIIYEILYVKLLVLILCVWYWDETLQRLVAVGLPVRLPGGARTPARRDEAGLGQ
jgi:hypothetical protein